jgi:hypothetical protein
VKYAVISPVAVIAPVTDKVLPLNNKLFSPVISVAETEVITLLSPGLVYVVIPAFVPVAP